MVFKQFSSKASIIVMHDHPNHGSAIMGGMFGIRSPFQPRKDVFDKILKVCCKKISY